MGKGTKLSNKGKYIFETSHRAKQGMGGGRVGGWELPLEIDGDTRHLA